MHMFSKFGGLYYQYQGSKLQKKITFPPEMLDSKRLKFCLSATIFAFPPQFLPFPERRKGSKFEP